MNNEFLDQLILEEEDDEIAQAKKFLKQNEGDSWQEPPNVFNDTFGMSSNSIAKNGVEVGKFD